MSSVAGTCPGTLEELLRQFRQRAMVSKPVRRLLEGWERRVEVRVLEDPGSSYVLCSRGGAMEGPSAPTGAEPDMVVVAEEPVLKAVFSGKLNPARAHLDGDLQAFGTQRDQLVLDALVMLIWGY